MVAAFVYTPIKRLDITIDRAEGSYTISPVLDPRVFAWRALPVAEAHDVERVAINLAKAIREDARIWIQVDPLVRRCRAVPDPTYPNRKPRSAFASGDILIHRYRTTGVYNLASILAPGRPRTTWPISEGFSSEAEALDLARRHLVAVVIWLKDNSVDREYRQVWPVERRTIAVAGLPER